MIILNLPPSRSEATALGVKNYFTGLPCTHGHIDIRQTSNGVCRSCRHGIWKKWSKGQDNKARVNKWIENNKDKHLQGHRIRCERYRQANKDKVKASTSQWAKRNPDYVNFKAVERLEFVKKATPKWLSEDQILAIKLRYKEAKTLSSMTGVKHHVDHIVPLRGVNVSGLNVPWNLRVITAQHNIKKGNR